MSLWFYQRFCFETPPEAPKPPLERLKESGPVPPAAQLKSLRIDVATDGLSDQVGKGKIVADWMKTENPDAGLKENVNILAVDKGDYALYRLIRRYFSVPYKELLTDGVPDYQKMRKVLTDDNEDGKVAKTLGFYAVPETTGTWAVVDTSGSDEVIRGTGDFLKTLEKIFTELRSDVRDNSISQEQLAKLETDVLTFSLDYDILTGAQSVAGLESAQRKNITQDFFKESRKFVDSLKGSSESWQKLNPDSLRVLSEQGLDHAGSYKFRLSGNKIYALRYTDEKDLPRLRVMDVSLALVNPAQPADPAKPVNANKTFVLNAALWKSNLIQSDEAAKVEVMKLTDSLSPAEKQQVAVKAATSAPTEAGLAKLAETLLKNKKDFHYSFPPSTATATELHDKILALLPPVSTDLTSEKREQAATARAKQLMPQVELAIARFHQGILINPNYVTEEQRRDMKIDFSFDGNEGVVINATGASVVSIIKGAEEKMKKDLEGKKEDIASQVDQLSETGMGGILFKTLFDGDKKQFADAVSGKDFFGHLMLGIFGVGKGKAMMEKLSRKFPALAGFPDTVKGFVTKATGGMFDLDNKKVKGSELAAMAMATKLEPFKTDLELREGVTLSKPVLASKIIFPDDISIFTPGKGTEQYEGGKVYSDVKLAQGTVLPKETVLCKGTQFLPPEQPVTQVAGTPSSVPPASPSTPPS
ncbi:MAG: hypothetical protein AAB551_03485 [Patescibacteria group bacterium]